jgi:hypothetical protein
MVSVRLARICSTTTEAPPSVWLSSGFIQLLSAPMIQIEVSVCPNDSQSPSRR